MNNVVHLRTVQMPPPIPLTQPTATRLLRWRLSLASARDRAFGFMVGCALILFSTTFWAFALGLFLAAAAVLMIVDDRARRDWLRGQP